MARIPTSAFRVLCPSAPPAELLNRTGGGETNTNALNGLRPRAIAAWLLALASAVVAASPASAALLWDNTLEHNVETSGRAFGGGVWSDYIVADNFSAGKPWLLSGIRFETIDIGDWQFESVDVYLFLDRSGNGTSEPVFHRFLGTWSGSGFDTGRRDRGFPVMRYSVSLSAVIEQGYYYLGLNANGKGTTGATFWATSDGGEGGNTPGWYFNGSRWFYEGPPPDPWDHAFEIHGDVVPEPPSALTLSVAVTLLAAHRRGRRREGRSASSTGSRLRHRAG